MDEQPHPTDPKADQLEGSKRTKKKKKPVPQPPPDPHLDLTSPEFDAELALRASTGVQLPVPDAPVLDNISRCAGMLQLPEEQQPAEQQQTQEQSIEAQAKKAKAAALKQRALQATKQAEASVKLGTLPDIMQSAVTAGGPIAALATWQSAGQRVYVVTRHASGVRGRAVGTLVAFDKYMNLLLRDVEETYTVIVKVQRVKQQVLQNQQQQQQQGLPADQQQQRQGTTGDQQQQPQQPHQQQPQGQSAEQQQRQQPGPPAMRTRTRWCRKQQQRYRRLDQILLKGDNIVLVSGNPPPLQHPAGTPGAATAAAAAANADAVPGL